MKPLRLSALIIAVLSLVGCNALESKSPGSAAATSSMQEITSATLLGTRWIAQRVDGAATMPSTQLTLDFRPDYVSGFGGCNGFGGAYDPAHPVGFKDVVITVAGCMKEGIEKQEDAFYKAVAATRSARMEGNRLVLVDATGRPRVELSRRPPPPVASRPMPGTRWRLESMNGEAVPEDAFVTLEFLDHQHFRRVHACQSVAGTYTIWADELRFTSSRLEEDRCANRELGPLSRYDYPGDVQQFWNDGTRLHLIGRNHRRAVMRACPACAMDPRP